MTAEETKRRIIEAAEKAIKQLIKVAEEDILKPGDEETPAIAADRLKNAAATKKLAIFDAFELLGRIELEKEMLKEVKNGDTGIGFAEKRAGKR